MYEREREREREVVGGVGGGGGNFIVNSCEFNIHGKFM